MNNALPFRRRPKTGLMTRVILLISFIILFARLVFTIPAAIEHHQQKKLAAETESVIPARHNPITVPGS